MQTLSEIHTPQFVQFSATLHNYSDQSYNLHRSAIAKFIYTEIFIELCTLPIYNYEFSGEINFEN